MAEAERQNKSMWAFTDDIMNDEGRGNGGDWGGGGVKSWRK